MSVGRFELHPDDDGFPEILRRVPRPPRILHGIGDPEALVPGLAVIGSRKATPYGRGCAKLLAGWAAEHGVTIISGGAIGCDLAAHAAALDAGASTIAVLGCGADIDYPSRASGILAAIRGGRGAVVSEFPWGTPPMRGHFPARNRIIAGLASAVLVLEAAVPSGTFSTADHALDAGRDVLAVPGSVFFAGSAGCNRLIRQGAAPIGSIDDLADSLIEAGLLAPVERDGGRSSFVPDTVRAPSALLDALLADPMSPDRLAVALDMDARSVLSGLARLETRGLVARYPDGTYGPCVL